MTSSPTVGPAAGPGPVTSGRVSADAGERLGPGPGGRGRLAALDGLRALAIAVVLAYHSGVGPVRSGGFYGQDIFFVLSGFLITGLLLDEDRARGRIGLVGFWGRRARRLLPALALMLVVSALYVARVAPPGRYPTFGGDAVSAAFYFSNWHLISTGSNYFASGGAPSLLTHTWSLAVEEQFYLTWPLVVALIVRLARRRGRDGARAVAAVAAAGAAVSAAWMAWLRHAGSTPSRLYYGTDTHAQTILVGCALAAWMARPGAGARPAAAGRARARAATGAAGLAGVAAVVTLVGPNGGFAYDGGYLCLAAAVAALIAAAVREPSAPVTRALAVRPFAYLGRISYGVYLWYFPVFAVVDHARLGISGPPLFAARSTVTIAIAAASFHLVERPLQASRLFRVGVASGGGPGRPVRSLLGAARPLLAGVGGVAAAATLAAVDMPPGVEAPAADLTARSAVLARSPGGAGVPWRLMVVGDSTAVTLGIDLAAPAARQGIEVVDDASLGCGVAVSAEVLDHGAPVRPAPGCDSSTPTADQWPARMRAEIRTVRPEAVLVAAGRWETMDRRPAGGRWSSISTPAGESYVERQLDLAVRIGVAQGASVLLATSPCFSTGEQPDGSPWPEDAATRVAAYDRAARAAAAASGGRAAVIDLGGLVCPRGRFHTTVDGVTVRAPDGIHYPFFSTSDPGAAAPDTEAVARAFGRWLAARILPALLAACRHGS